MVTRIMYKKIHQLKRQGWSKARITTELGLHPKTVAKYYPMTEAAFRATRRAHRYREKVFDDYQPAILAVYGANDHRPLNMAAVYDYLEERFGALPGNEQTLRNYIQYLIQTGTLTLQEHQRTYTPVPALPFGQQLQVDCGQWRCPSGLKLFVFAAVLSASRQKYVTVQDRPFRTREVIDHLLACFEYLGGVPRELVIDQDHLLVVSENAGDIIYTSDFQTFIEEQRLHMYVCRKADPESKGKVENCIKYVKQNCFSVRDFATVPEANAALRDWLDRRANGKISQATQRIPADVWPVEQRHLRSLRPSIFRKDALIEREDRTANANAGLSVEACLYQLPLRYRHTTVEMDRTDHRLFVFDRNTGEALVEYPRSLVPGKTISNRAFKRVSTHPLSALKAQVRALFPGDLWQQFVTQNWAAFPRYVRDQCLEAQRYFGAQSIDPAVLERALTFCLENTTVSMANLRDTTQYFQRETAGAAAHATSPEAEAWKSSEHPPVAVTRRPLAEYNALLGPKGNGVK